MEFLRKYILSVICSNLATLAPLFSLFLASSKLLLLLLLLAVFNVRAADLLYVIVLPNTHAHKPGRAVHGGTKAP